MGIKTPIYYYNITIVSVVYHIYLSHMKPIGSTGNEFLWLLEIEYSNHFRALSVIFVSICFDYTSLLMKMQYHSHWL